VLNLLVHPSDDGGGAPTNPASLKFEFDMTRDSESVKGPCFQISAPGVTYSSA
jgi:hypothetical protein